MNMEDTAFNLAKDGIINFNSQNYVILPSSGVGMDTNMFVLSNIYDGNFAGRMASITEIKNIRKVHITGELYINNRGTYSEALEKFGMIHSISTYATAGLSYSISQYFDYSNKSNYIPTLFSSVLLEQQYPVSPLYIEGSFYISIADSVFDNNVFPEITSDKQSSYYSSPGITIKACNGDLHIKSLTFQNYQGMSVTEINSITGTENAVFVDPVSRVSKTGLPTEEISSPLYPLDYGIKNSLIRLVKDTQGFENVYFDNMNIDGLVVKNITQYEVPSLNPLILHIDKFNTNVNISNVEVSDVDIIASNHDLIKIASAVSVKLTNASFTNINVNGYNLDTKDYQYLSFQGAVFYIQQQAALNQTVESKYTFDNITIDTVFASEGGAFYMADETGTLLSEFLHQIINISTLTVKNSVCKVNGMIKTYYVQFEISIHNSLFQNNTGVDCEADLSISAMWSLDIYNSSFIGSNTLSDIYARSMEFSLTDPYSSTPNLISVTVQ